VWRINDSQFTENVKILHLYSGLYIPYCEKGDSVLNLSKKPWKTLHFLDAILLQKASNSPPKPSFVRTFLQRLKF
jgi:hypothetical protein